MVIFITGISSGFGAEIAKLLNQKGHTIYGTVRREVEKIVGVNYLMVDVRDNNSITDAIDFVIKKEGKIDVLINNAGIGIGGPIEFSSLEDIGNQMDTNFMGCVRCTKAVLPYMREVNCGKIICLSSIGGLIGLPYQGFYSASKFAIEGFCQALRLECSQFNIKVVVINPGDFSTHFTQNRKNQLSEDASSAYPSLKASMKSIENDENGGLKPLKLAKVIAKIVEKRSPKYRYIIASPLQKLAVVAKRILPPRLFSWILKLYYKV